MHTDRLTKLSRVLVGLAIAAALSSSAPRPAAAQDPLKAAPNMYKLLFENDRVRVMEVTFKPGRRLRSTRTRTASCTWSPGTAQDHRGRKVTDVDVTPDRCCGSRPKHWAVNTGRPRCAWSRQS
jgi:hypothetical protein